MRLLDRYLFRELLTPLAICLGGFLIVSISFELFTKLEELQAAKLHTLDILCYTLAMTPEFLVQVLPIALLLALLYALTNHARCNEITAMRAAGISLWRICAPYFVVGFIASGIYFAMKEILVPRSTDWADKVLTRYVPKSAAAKNAGSISRFHQRSRTSLVALRRISRQDNRNDQAAGELEIVRWFELSAQRSERKPDERRVDIFQRVGICADRHKRVARAVVGNKYSGHAGIQRNSA